MRTHAVIAGIVMSMFAGQAPATGADTLEAYRWRARPVLVVAAPGDARADAQKGLMEAARAELAARDVVVIEADPSTPLGRRFGPAFSVVLVGKDGGEKARWREPVDPQAIAREIDGMPMRREEMRREKGRS